MTELAHSRPNKNQWKDAVVVHLMHDRAYGADRPVVAISLPASTIAADATLDEALRTLLNAGSKYLVVIAPGNRFVGVLGHRELVAAWASRPIAARRDYRRIRPRRR
jgi:CBS-domain-containing membrane protein